ncbi:hypothetical protein [Polynucleobacter sp. MWH-UH23A]|uniref:hypothetical protein n=1 Tax=Polynucleobacter sp. MWH-UH23A TaxID=1855613 RepID=UPI0033652938
MRIKFIPLIFLIAVFGCTPLPLVQTQKKIEPYQDANAYSQGNWIVLAQSSSKDWYYDPSTLSKDDEGMILFWSYWVPKSVATNTNLSIDQKAVPGGPAQEQVNDPSLKNPPFNSKIYGPYLQKIDCFTNFHSSESLIDGSCDLSEAPAEAQSAIIKVTIDCWRKVKPKTAIAFIENRVCGRKFPMDTIRNYFLFQDQEVSSPSKKAGSSESTSSLGDGAVKKLPEAKNRPSELFYEVVNNEYIVIDAKKNVREMRISSYFLDKNLSPRQNYLYRASCSEKVDHLYPLGKSAGPMRAIGAPTSLSGVAFNRICADHGKYMTQVTRFTP